MKRPTMRRTLPVFLVAAGIVPAGSALAATHAPVHANKTVKVKKYKGPAVSMRWGPVQVTIAVKGKKITNISATAPMERSRSAFINSQAIPLLKQEVLQAQSATVDTISGATLTSDAYIQSLQAALQKAHL
jgi:uncharacterized protein with FMN-binding domain